MKKPRVPEVISVPYVELTGRTGVRIEPHCGISEFTSERMSVRLKKGCVVITGKGLKISLMTKECIVVSGCIDSASYTM